jgi:predicted N-acetyltransferase YhbS
MDLTLRPGTPDDAEVCGRICFDAFGAISAAHSFPSDFAVPEAAIGLAGMLLGHPGFYSVVAEADGRVIGSNFLDERSPIRGVGPITVDPGVQNGGVGRALMLDVLRRAADAPGVRLVQAAYHGRSLSLYAKLGFRVRGLLACMQGDPLGVEIPGYHVRPATTDDLIACADVCRAVHGHDRTGELADAVGQGGALVVEHDGRITGYASGVAFFHHAVGESNEDLKALIGAAGEIGGSGILVPAENSELFEWCLAHGLRVVQPMTLMSTGLYVTPQGAFLPSILY